jgi:hypothetical protein
MAGEAKKQTAISEQAFVDRFRKTDRWMIGLTAVIAFATVISAIIFFRQLSVMQGQLEEMRSSGHQTDETIKALQQQTSLLDRKIVEANRAWIAPQGMSLEE